MQEKQQPVYRKILLGERTALVTHNDGVYVVWGTIGASYTGEITDSNIMPVSDVHEKSLMTEMLRRSSRSGLSTLVVFSN